MLRFGSRALALLATSLLGCACANPVIAKRLPPTAQLPYAFDQHRVIEILPASTAAILEVTYNQRNIEYLLEGTKRALLLDSGPGQQKMAPVIAALTDLPVTVVPSHLHFDHVGGLGEFADVALIDAEDLRERTVAGVFTPTPTEHLGWMDRDPLQAIRVARWLQPGARIDLGDRTVEVLLTPGHTKTSVMLYDPAMPALFTGDFLYPGGLFVESLEQYRTTLAMLLRRMPKNVTIYPAHNTRARKTPTFAYRDLDELHKAVCKALDGSIEGKPSNAFGIPATAYPVNQRLHMFVLKWPRKPDDSKTGQ